MSDLPSIEELFERGTPEPNTGCWLWTGAGSHGPQIRVCGRALLVTRIVLGITDRPEVEACHHCDQPSCFNPAHLFPGTHAENMADMTRKGRQAVGVQHPLARLNDQLVAELRALAAAGVSHRELARRVGLSQTTVSKAISGAKWRHVQ